MVRTVFGSLILGPFMLAGCAPALPPITVSHVQHAPPPTGQTVLVMMSADQDPQAPHQKRAREAVAIELAQAGLRPVNRPEEAALTANLKVDFNVIVDRRLGPSDGGPNHYYELSTQVSLGIDLRETGSAKPSWVGQARQIVSVVPALTRSANAKELNRPKPLTLRGDEAVIRLARAALANYPGRNP